MGEAMNDSNGPSTHVDREMKSRTGREVFRFLAHTLHRFRWAVALIVGMLSAGQFASATQKVEGVLKTKTVIAEKYELRGADGKTSAVLSREGTGQARLEFLDEKGGLRLAVGMWPGGTPGITMFDDKTNQRLSIGMNLKEKATYLYLFDAQKNVAMSLTMHEEGGPWVTIGGPEKGQVLIGLSEQGEPRVYLFAKKKEPRIGLELNDGAPAIMLYEKGVRTVWKLKPDGSPVFSILDDQSRERLSIGASDDHPYIRFVDPDKKTFKDIRQVIGGK
jgi:hypothetical protein